MWVALWVQSVWEKISLCVTLLNRVPADTLSANPSVATTPGASPRVGLGVSGEVKPLLVPLFAEETTTNPGGRGAACEFRLRHRTLSPRATVVTDTMITH